MYRFTISANAGVSLELPAVRVWVDALHELRADGFSPVTPPLLARMERESAFQAPDIIFFTHCHRDHYSREMTERAMSRWPAARVILPQQEFERQLPLGGGRAVLALPDGCMEFFPLPHEREEHSYPHYGCIIESGGRRILFAGDCAVCAPELAAAAGGRHIDAAVLCFPWITLPRGRRFVEDELRPDKLIINHLPFAGDDLYGYRDAAISAAEKVRASEVRLMTEPLQSETFY